MSKRLQVTLQDYEFREIQKVARSRNMTISEWVRQTLAEACRRESSADIGKKLEVVRAAVRRNFPTAEIGAVLQDVESGYNGGSRP
jgi:hypothetical protein